MQHDDTHLRSHLEALPDPPLPASLWPRVAAARRRQLARRRVALGGGVAIAMVLLVLPSRLPPRQVDDMVALDTATATAARQVSSVQDASDPGARLRILDRELQAAYLRGSDAAGIAQLWEAREALLREQRAVPVRPVRI